MPDTFFSKQTPADPRFSGTKNAPRKRRWIKWVLGVIAVLVLLGGAILWKAGSIVGRIAPKGSILSNIVNSLPGVQKQLAGEESGRVNVALLGMRGANDAAGGLLADTIMILSFHPKNGEGDAPRASLVSIPRDLYVTVPGTSDKQKINYVHFSGEQKGKGQGLDEMKTILSEVSGQPIQYAASINFDGFKQLIDEVGGVTVHLDAPFSESNQFRQPHVCDANVFTVPTSPLQYENKYVTTKSGRRRVVASYPLCFNKDVECGGVFELPAGDNTLDGEKALCFARARYNSNDFERAKRQHMVIEAIQLKLLSLGTLSDFGKLNGILNNLGSNVQTDMAPWELKRFFDLYLENKEVKLSRDVVVDNSDDGLLYAPQDTGSAGYILLPKGDNYDRIHELFSKIP